ncbi:hypothetical protein CABS03_07993 [Colletotrichum abscissum]|uniref:Transmembrane protein n=1 Tax=Colletotrichum abscissum TaxID=1671311 RepID=A0A9P9XAG9_9PEZI|nr:hypothetical protein CABS02_09756 [Colletotrichum abscissum]
MYEGRFGLGKGGRPECSVCHGGTTSAVSQVKVCLGLGLVIRWWWWWWLCWWWLSGLSGFLLSWFVARSNPAAASSGINCRRKDNAKRGGCCVSVRSTVCSSVHGEIPRSSEGV